MKDPRIDRFNLEGFNKPKKTPGHPTKSHVVLAKDGDTTKLIRFGQQGVRGIKNPQTEAERKKRAAFKARFADEIKKGKLSAAF